MPSARDTGAVRAKKPTNVVQFPHHDDAPDIELVEMLREVVHVWTAVRRRRQIDCWRAAGKVLGEHRCGPDLDVRAVRCRVFKRRPSVDPTRAAVARVAIQALYSVRSERLLMEQMDYNLLFRWFVGLSCDSAWKNWTPIDRLPSMNRSGTPRRSARTATACWRETSPPPS